MSTDLAGAGVVNPAVEGSSAGRANPAGAVSPAGGFGLDRPWRLDERVAIRPEPFGALLYHFGTRRLSFLKNATMLAVVRSLGEHPSARAACAAAGIQPARMAAYERGLATLAESGMITLRMSSQRGAA